MNIFRFQTTATGFAFLLSVTLASVLTAGNPAPKAAPLPDKNNIVYVDNVNGDDANPGTYAEPKATIQAGENAAEELYGADGAVVVRGGGPPYEEGTISVSTSMKFHGNGVGLKEAKAHGNAPPPVLNGGFDAFGIESITVQGFEIMGVGPSSPVALANVGDAVIVDNYLHDFSSYGILLITWDASVSSVYLENNRIVTTNGNSVVVTSMNDSRLTLVASSNKFSDAIPFANGYGFTLDSVDSSEMNAALYGNEMTGLMVGIAATSNQDSLLKLVAAGNSIARPSHTGMALQSLGDSRQEVELTRNEFDSGGMGAFYALSYENSTFDFTARANVANADSTVGGAGVGVTAVQTSEMNATFEDNRIQGSIGAGTGGEGVLNFTAISNEITRLEGYIGQGLGLFGGENGVINGTLSKNRIKDVGGDGILLMDNGTSTVSVTALDGNVITGADGHGIHVDFANAANSVNGTQNNVVEEAGGNSLEVVNEPVNGQIKLNGVIISPLVDTP